MAFTPVTGVTTSYDGTGLWSNSYLPWLVTSFPWLQSLGAAKPTTTWDTRVDAAPYWDEMTMTWDEATLQWGQYNDISWTKITQP